MRARIGAQKKKKNHRLRMSDPDVPKVKFHSIAKKQTKLSPSFRIQARKIRRQLLKMTSFCENIFSALAAKNSIARK